jgi:C4-dicarboxylate-specific signal transduction histidine kinase
VRQRTEGIEDCAINDVVTNVLALLKPEIRLQQARIVTRLQAQLPTVRGDRVLLEQVLLNLVLNSLQAMQQLPVERRLVEIDTTHVDGTVYVRVADQGPGIAPAIAAQLFEPFFTTKTQGLGLGLNICRTIVESHRGHLSFENRADGGAVFTLQLECAP